ncbi:MAG: phosphatase PAP2 family protein [Nitrospirales bacterium]|nr:phosphatase PAP2 family protein [Nitrospirales bacterium]
MTETGDGSAAPWVAQPMPPPARPSGWAVLLSTLALLGSFATLLHIDIPILWFLRSHNLAAWQRVGDLGEKLGNGGTLVAISLVIGATGLLLKRQALTRLALDSLLAHGVVALVVNTLKHVIGRPRPRLTHSGGWQWWPSLDSGLDSFPSGHTSATVAVVTVLARALPRMKWVPFALAAWVGASRIWRGSHFPSDVVAGMVTGFIIGSVFNGPLRWWARSCVVALIRIAPAAVALAALFWILTHRIADPATDAAFLLSGTGLVIGGLVLPWVRSRRIGAKGSSMWQSQGDCLVWLGMGFASGASVIIGLTGLVCLARWIFTASGAMEVPVPAYSWRRQVVFGVGAGVTLALLQSLKGLVPLQ